VLEMSCAPGDLLCTITDGVAAVVSKAANDSLQEMANATLEAYGRAMTSLGTAWVRVPTPVLTSGSGSTVTTTPPAGAAFTQILNYVSYVSLVICILSVVGFGIMLAVRGRRGDGQAMVGRLGFALGAVVLITGASAVVSAILPNSAPGGSSTTVGFLQSSLWFYVGGLAILSVIVGGVRMAWTQRAQPGKELIQSLLTLVVVSGAGLVVIGLAVTAADSFSVWILNNSTGCDVASATSGCFGENMLALMALASNSAIGLIGILILGAIALLLTYLQVALMIVRGGMLVILAGILPATASFTNTAMGKQWFQKTVGWTIAFILYKPAAAIVYAAAFKLAGSNVFQSDGSGVWSIMTGLALMAIALVALPALMRLIAPMTAAVAGGGAAGLALAGGAGALGGEVASGAVQRMGSNSRSASGAGAGPSASGAATGAKAAGAAGGGVAAGGGAAAGGAAAAAGPVGIGVAAAGAVASGAVKAGKAVGGAVQGAASAASDDPMTSGPSGA
jgi:type IV secretion system protein TrbL